MGSVCFFNSLFEFTLFVRDPVVAYRFMEPA